MHTFVNPKTNTTQVDNTKSDLLKPNFEDVGHNLSGAQTSYQDFGKISVLPSKPIHLQPKLTINTPGDKYEQEADRVAEQVMRMPDVEVRDVASANEKNQRKCAACEGGGTVCPKCAEEEEKIQMKPLASQIKPLIQRQSAMEEELEEEEEVLQTKSIGQSAKQSSPDLTNRIQSSRGGGMVMDTGTRQFMEPRFGADFGEVRIHSNKQAADMNREINARAFTVGQDIYFNSGAYNPGSVEGKKLLAHELTHVVQQEQWRGSTVPPTRIQRQPSSIKLKESKPFGHGDLKDDALKKKWRTYIGATTLLQVTPAGNYKGHCVKEYLTEVSNTCPTRFKELRKSSFCTASKCLDFDRWKNAGDASTGKTTSDGPDSFLDRHRTRHPESLLEGTGKNKCSVVCHQLYKYDRKKTIGAFYIIRNFRAGSYTPTGTKATLHITTGDVQKVQAPVKIPSKKDFAKQVAPGLKKRGKLLDSP